MTLLAGKLYDPSTLATKATSALLAMTALDTTNLRLGFTVPANGAVLVRIRVATEGNATHPGILLGVLEGSTVRGRVSPMGTTLGASATSRAGNEVLFVVPGLTPSASLTWDAAYGVENTSTSTSIRYGGPNDATTDNAHGGVSFEIYDTSGLLGAVLYDPAALVNKPVALAAMTAFDTTNLRITFTAPASGNVLVRMRCLQYAPGGTMAQPVYGVLDGSTIRARTVAAGGFVGSVQSAHDATMLVTGLTPSSSYTWDAAYSVDIVGGSANFRYGGPNNTTTNDAAGAFQYEIWAV